MSENEKQSSSENEHDKNEEESSETGVVKRVKAHRHKLRKQRELGKEPPVAKYLSALVKKDKGYTAVVNEIKELVLDGWQHAS